MDQKSYNQNHLTFLLSILFLAACGGAASFNEAGEIGSAPVPLTLTLSAEDANGSQGGAAASATPSFTNVRIQDDNEYNIRFLIPFDGIAPIYDPIFVTAVDAPLIDDELIIGVAWGGEAKAYPISVLRFREMVNDELAGIPTLVTW
ncbi:MAG: DUF3179 domain-containing protein [Chloroflexi bacterium]|nr:DUF3179 domain-containing protein [Chloroflexota bacterium]